MPQIDWSLDRWVKEVYDIYGVRNEDIDPQVLWLEVVDATSKLYEEIRKGNVSDKVMESVTELFLWLCAFVGKYTLTPQIDPEDPLWILSQDTHRSYTRWILWKYPGVCHFCGQDRCLCVLHEEAIETRHEKEEIDEYLVKGLREVMARREHFDDLYNEYSNKPIDDLIRMFNKIYDPKITLLDLWKITAHLLEEVGEVAHEICRLTTIKDSLQKLQGESNEARRLALKDAQYKVAEELKRELADVFSWLTSFLHKLGDIWRSARNKPNEDYSFSELVTKFPFLEEISTSEFGCYHCKERPCREDCRIVVVEKELNAKLNERKKREEAAKV